MAMKHILQACTATVLGLVLSVCVHAQSADKILSEHIKAIGGAKALKTISGRRLAGDARVASSTQAAAFTLATKSPDRLYLEISGTEDGWSEAYNGRSAWRKDAAAGVQTFTGAESAQLKCTAFYWNDRFLTYKNLKISAQLLGRENFEGRDVFVIEMGDRSGLRRKFFFDAANYLLLKEQEEGPGAGGETLYGDYRPIDGVQEPHRIVLRRGGQILEITVRHVSHGADAAAGLFDFPHTAAALPDAATLLEQVRKNQKKLEELRHNYTCMVTTLETEMSSKGQVSEKSAGRYELFFLGRTAVAKHISKNGQPLSEQDQKKEQEKVDKAFRKYDEEQKKAAASGKPASGEPEEKDDITIQDFLNAARIYNPRRERFRGRDVIVFDFEPRENYKPKTFGESIVQKLTGAVWVDDQAQEVARLEARSTGSIKIGGGLLASLNAGSWLVQEQELVNNEVWMPVYAEQHLSGRILLLKGFKSDSIVRFSDYKKFSVEVKLSAPPQNPPPF